MYKKSPEGWLKHIDFILLDMLMIQLAFVIACFITQKGTNPYAHDLYSHVALFLVFMDFLISFLNSSFKNVLKRGKYREFRATFKHAAIVAVCMVMYLFMIHSANEYSRASFIILFVIYIPLTYVVRMIYKRVLGTIKKQYPNRSLMLITSSDIAETVVNNIRSKNYAGYGYGGIAIIDKDMVGQNIAGFPINCNAENVLQRVCEEWIDEIFIIVGEKCHYPQELIDSLKETGVTLHINLARITNQKNEKQFVEKLGDYTVVTSSLNVISIKARVAKRLMDIVGGLVGTLITGLLCIIVGPMIYMASPGPIFFSQERVGENGKHFKILKFRSMYLDAEERKKDLMKDNKLGSDKMFKLDFDPRVIGNEILPDGSIKTGIGDFIRRTSIDEFPQFINVLKGEMSLVGTRPPLPSEVEAYELHHHSRLAVKPGITGLWQISGRSDITDFEEVVKLDREYIMNRNLGMDIKIILQTIEAVIKGKGAV